MAKVVINVCYGGFSLSAEGIRRYAEIKGLKVYPEKGRYGGTVFWLDPPETRNPKEHLVLSSRDIPRHDPALVQVVEELGDRANGDCANLSVEELPAGTQYRIDEYDGNESIQTRDGTDWDIAT